MRRMSIDEMRRIQLEILADVAQFCKKNSLRYHLTYGTLLGAVRHKGYIPWDDDIDITMPRPDYMKFQEMYNKRGSVYKCLSYYTDPKFPYFIIKVEDTRTFQTDCCSGYDYGVNIDIHPLDGFPKYLGSTYLKILIKLKSILWLWSRQKASERNCIYRILSLMVQKLPFGIYKICLNVTDKMLRMSSYDNSEKVALLCVIGRERKEEFNRAMFEKTVELKFEGRCYPAPYRYDDILNRLYGDYMKLPPESERVLRHSVKAFWRQ